MELLYVGDPADDESMVWLSSSFVVLASLLASTMQKTWLLLHPVSVPEEWMRFVLPVEQCS